MMWDDLFEAAGIPESQRPIMKKMLTAQIAYAIGERSVEEYMASPEFQRHKRTLGMLLPIVANDEKYMKDLLKIFEKPREEVPGE